MISSIPKGYAATSLTEIAASDRYFAGKPHLSFSIEERSGGAPAIKCTSTVDDRPAASSKSNPKAPSPKTMSSISYLRDEFDLEQSVPAAGSDHTLRTSSPTKTPELAADYARVAGRCSKRDQSGRPVSQRMRSADLDVLDPGAFDLGDESILDRLSARY